MTSKDLNLKLIQTIPEINDAYIKETSWQDGDDTGSHVVYSDILVPFIKEQVAQNNENLLIRVFEYIEHLLTLTDSYANEVVALSVIETLFYDEEINNASFIQFAKPHTLQFIKEIMKSLEE